jgi:hypothetical protein
MAGTTQAHQILANLILIERNVYSGKIYDWKQLNRWSNCYSKSCRLFVPCVIYSFVTPNNRHIPLFWPKLLPCSAAFLLLMLVSSVSASAPASEEAPPSKGADSVADRGSGLALALASPMSSTSLGFGITHRYSVVLHQSETRGDSLSGFHMVNGHHRLGLLRCTGIRHM